jgi:hypothetical protein
MCATHMRVANVLPKPPTHGSTCKMRVGAGLCSQSVDLPLLPRLQTAETPK